MQAGWVTLYFILGCFAVALVIFPELRRGVIPHGRVALHKVARYWRESTPSKSGPRFEPRASAPWVLRWRWIAGGGALLLTPLALVLVWNLSTSRRLEGFDDRIDPSNPQVAHLLHGEHLVPPPPLPPDVFMTAEVEQARPMLSTADRRWSEMDPAFVQRLLTVFKIMKEAHGYEMALLEGYRSPERQALLAKKGSHVTMAGAWQSYHQYGLASDCAFYRDGKLVISERDPWAMRGYQLYGEVAEQVGLTWGGRWQMMDLGHVEWRKSRVKPSLKAPFQRPAPVPPPH
jgi:peptidoglycan L-alanyl-D-glutamate endopeptidase CwlK